MMLGALVNFIGALLQSSSFSLPQLIVGRLVSGFGFGHLTATAPNWQAECSTAGHRGAVVLLESVFISAGLAIAAWVTFGVSHATGSVTWRFPLALSGFWSLIVLLTTPHMPESPRWLMAKGKVAEARQTLGALKDVDPESLDVNIDIQEIEDSLALSGQSRFADIFRNGNLRLFHRTCLAAAGQMFQQVWSSSVEYITQMAVQLSDGCERCRESMPWPSTKRRYSSPTSAFPPRPPESLQRPSSRGRLYVRPLGF